MKIAITSSGNSPDAIMDSRFGRCKYFVFYDTETGAMEFLPNPNIDAIEGAGPASVQLVASKSVDKVVSGEFGNKVKALFDSLKIQLIIPESPDLTINQIINMFILQRQ
ncbi:MAG: NifB/NifX family molybdenum-iron cluster-binding protein [Bacteroidales bacterium]|jgi:predicted Fe-Mo cluster-binding NifX family protein